MGKKKAKKPKFMSASVRARKVKKGIKVKRGVPFITIRRNGQLVSVAKPMERLRTRYRYRTDERKTHVWTNREGKEIRKTLTVITGWNEPNWENFPRRPEQYEV